MSQLRPSRREPKDIPRAVAHPAPLVALKAGAATRPLFMFPGAGCDWREVEPLARSVARPWSVIGVEAWRAADPAADAPRTVEQMADLAFEAIIAAQPNGPYHLIGYSFGGLVALEVAGALLRQEKQVQLLTMIDSPIDHRHWSFAQRVRGRLNQIMRILRMPADVRLAKVRDRIGYIAARLRRDVPPPERAAERCEVAFRQYSPRHYPSRVILIGPDRSRDIGVDIAELWTPCVGTLEVRRVAGGHHELVRSPLHVEALAQVLNQVLDEVASSAASAQ
jgi:acetoacetyl-CoA synthetase